MKTYHEREHDQALALVHKTLEEFENAAITIHFCLRKTLHGNHVIMVKSSFPKSFVSKAFSVHS